VRQGTKHAAHLLERCIHCMGGSHAAKTWVLWQGLQQKDTSVSLLLAMQLSNTSLSPLFARMINCGLIRWQQASMAAGHLGHTWKLSKPSVSSFSLPAQMPTCRGLSTSHPAVLLSNPTCMDGWKLHTTSWHRDAPRAHPLQATNC
jgi:hypothetical protein